MELPGRRTSAKTSALDLSVPSWSQSSLEPDAAAQAHANVSGPSIHLLAGNGERLESQLITSRQVDEDSIRDSHVGPGVEGHDESLGRGAAGLGEERVSG